MNMDRDMDMEEGNGDEEMGEFYMAEEIDGDKIDPEYLRFYEKLEKEANQLDNGYYKGDQTYRSFSQGTNYEFDFVRFGETTYEEGLLIKLWTMLEAVNQADNSRFFMKTQVRHNQKLKGSEVLWWETCFCGEEEINRKEYDEWENEAIDDQYKGEMPKWLSDVDKQQCYVVEESEFKENESFHLFAEFAFFLVDEGHCRSFEIVECLPLEIDEVIVETRGEAETEPREKLKAANAIFYMSFECRDEPWEGNHSHYRVVMRKTMDGKPGHVRLEVDCSIIGIGEREEDLV